MSSRLNQKLFIAWLKKARFAQVSKNSVKQELLEELSNCVTLSFMTDDIKDNEIVISESRLTALISFLQNNVTITARNNNNNNMSDDALLNWNKSIEDCWKTVAAGSRTIQSLATTPAVNTRSIDNSIRFTDNKADDV